MAAATVNWVVATSNIPSVVDLGLKHTLTKMAAILLREEVLNRLTVKDAGFARRCIPVLIHLRNYNCISATIHDTKTFDVSEKCLYTIL